MGLYHKIITEGGEVQDSDIVPATIDEKKNGS